MNLRRGRIALGWLLAAVLAGSILLIAARSLALHLRERNTDEPGSVAMVGGADGVDAGGSEGSAAAQVRESSAVLPAESSEVTAAVTDEERTAQDPARRQAVANGAEEPSAGGGGVVGRVIDSDGRPVRARLRWVLDQTNGNSGSAQSTSATRSSAGSGEVTLNGVTEDNGEFRVRFPRPLDFELTVTADPTREQAQYADGLGRLFLKGDVRAGQWTHLDEVVLQRTGSLAVSVQAGEQQLQEHFLQGSLMMRCLSLAVPGAEPAAAGADSESLFESGGALSGQWLERALLQDGSARFELPEGWALLEVLNAKRESVSVGRAYVLAGETVEHRLDLWPGSPSRQAWVQLYSRHGLQLPADLGNALALSGHGLQNASPRVFAELPGLFLFENLEDESYLLTLSHSNFAHHMGELRPGFEAVEVIGNNALSLRVYDARTETSLPGEDFSVSLEWTEPKRNEGSQQRRARLRGREVNNDVGGGVRMRYDRLPRGDWDLLISAPGYETRRMDLEFGASVEVREFDVALSDGVTLSGQVQTAVSQPGGSDDLNGFAQPGRVLGRSVPSGRAVPGVTVEWFAAWSLGAESIEGELLEANGSLSWADLGEREILVPKGRLLTDSEGRYAIEDLFPGTYLLCVRDEDRVLGAAEVSVGRRDLRQDLTVRPTRMLRGSIPAEFPSFPHALGLGWQQDALFVAWPASLDADWQNVWALPERYRISAGASVASIPPGFSRRAFELGPFDPEIEAWSWGYLLSAGPLETIRPASGLVFPFGSFTPQPGEFIELSHEALANALPLEFTPLELKGQANAGTSAAASWQLQLSQLAQPSPEVSGSAQVPGISPSQLAFPVAQMQSTEGKPSLALGRSVWLFPQPYSGALQASGSNCVWPLELALESSLQSTTSLAVLHSGVLAAAGIDGSKLSNERFLVGPLSRLGGAGFDRFTADADGQLELCLPAGDFAIFRDGYTEAVHESWPESLRAKFLD